MTSTPSRRRSHRNGTEWQAIFTRVVDSGLSIPVFCKREALCVNSFRRWHARLVGTAIVKRPAAQTSVPAFVDLGPLVTPTASAAVSADEGRFELRLNLGAGIVLTLVRG